MALLTRFGRLAVSATWSAGSGTLKALRWALKSRKTRFAAACVLCLAWMGLRAGYVAATTTVTVDYVGSCNGSAPYRSFDVTLSTGWVDSPYFFVYESPLGWNISDDNGTPQPSFAVPIATAVMMTGQGCPDFEYGNAKDYSTKLSGSALTAASSNGYTFTAGIAQLSQCQYRCRKIMWMGNLYVETEGCQSDGCQFGCGGGVTAVCPCDDSPLYTWSSYADCGGTCCETTPPPPPCYAGDNDLDGVCDDVDCCSTNPSVGTTCPPCFFSCIQYYDDDHDGCCSNTDWNDLDPNHCSPPPCYYEGGDYDSDGCCGNVDCDDMDGSRCTNCPCEGHGGDGDGDGCCADVDVDDGDAERCAPDPCDLLGGDGDEDGCCAEDDADDGNPEICEPPPCWDPETRTVQDADGDGCCTADDVDDADPDRCQSPCANRGGDADRDNCCAQDDPDDNDPEKGCKCEECSPDVAQRLDAVRTKLTNWWPNLGTMMSTMQGGSYNGIASGTQPVSVILEVPYAFGPRVIELPVGLSDDAFGDFAPSIWWIFGFTRSVLVLYVGAGFAISIIKLGELV